MSNPILSIVIATYNYGRFLEAAIRSVLDQNCEGVELIIVDGGSTDNTIDIIKKYEEKIAWWVSESDSGQSEAFNKGFSHAKGRYLTWLNADDLMVSGCLKTIVRSLQKHLEIEWFTGNFFRFSTQGRILEIGWGPHVYPQFLQRKNSPIVSFGPSTIFAKSLWERMGRIDETLHYIMDTELWMRFIRNGVKQRRINYFCWAFRMHEDSKTAEYDDHKLSRQVAEKMEGEYKFATEKTGYHMSKFMHLVLNFWRVLDGSLLKRFLLKTTFRSQSVSLLNPISGGFFSFMQWCGSGWKKNGGKIKKDVSIPSKIRVIAGRLASLPPIVRKGKLLVMGSHRISTRAWPWCYLYEIIPVMWDLWPDNYLDFKKYCSRCKVKLVFCTSSQGVEWINSNCVGVRGVWMPEAIDLDVYGPGCDLESRTIDILNYGRQKADINQSIERFKWKNPINHVYRRGNELVFETFAGLLNGIKNAKMAICYPMIDTRPEKAKGVETLTQRYWECMASRTLMIGRAPKELIDICGYNPVIELGPDPCGQIQEILSNISHYQELVNRNRKVVEELGTWTFRMKEVMSELAIEGARL